MGLKGATTHGQRLNVFFFFPLPSFVSACAGFLLPVSCQPGIWPPGTAPFSGLPFGLPFFSMPWPHCIDLACLLVCLLVCMYMDCYDRYVGYSRMHVSSKQARRKPAAAVGTRQAGSRSGFFILFFLVLVHHLQNAICLHPPA